MKTAKEIEEGMANFYGTENYYRSYPGLVLTDGVYWLVQNASCHWIVDIIWSYQPKCQKDPMLRDMQFWTLTVDQEKKTAVIICERDTGDVAIRQEIEYTDFPLASVRLWVSSNGKERVIMLPSEY